MRKSNIEPIPVTISAWLELPYYISVPFEGVFPARISPDRTFDARISFHNDLLRIHTWNRWTHPTDKETFRGLGEAWIDPARTALRFAPRYCPESQIRTIAEQLTDAGAPYVHATETQTVVEVHLELMGRRPMGPYDDFRDVLPYPDFFDRQILPRVADIVDAYRIATLPRLRYALHPLTEAQVSEGVIELRDSTGAILQQEEHGFDWRGRTRGYDYLLDQYAVRERFYDSVQRIDHLSFETSISVTYCLYHMRRWTEALVIASSVVDALLNHAVFEAATSEELAKVIWSAYRTRSEDLFKSVLPTLGLAKLPDEDKALWDAYRKAREHRGSLAHGKGNHVFERESEVTTQQHLRAFARTARWLSLQAGRPWALDIEQLDDQDPIEEYP